MSASVVERPGTLRRMEPAVSCESVTKAFGSTVAVDGATVSVAPGEIVALLGPSGCGKTTFLRLVAGFERPDEGSISLAGETVSNGSTFVAPERRRVGFVFQDHALFPHMTVAANVGYGVADRARRARRVDDVLDLVGLRPLAARYPHELSGGEQQRVALARALAPDPRLILLDEPFASLDADLRARVRGEVRDILRRAGATAIFVTHDQQEALELADRVVVMDRGRFEQIGAAADVYHLPTTRAVADFVGEASFLPGDVREGCVDLELGRFALPGVTAAPGSVEVMVRPEDVVLDASGDASVLGSRFKGPMTVTTVVLPSGRPVASAHSSQIRFEPGARVGVRFEPDHIVLFRGDDRVAAVTLRQS